MPMQVSSCETAYGLNEELILTDAAVEMGDGTMAHMLCSALNENHSLFFSFSMKMPLNRFQVKGLFPQVLLSSLHIRFWLIRRLIFMISAT